MIPPLHPDTGYLPPGEHHAGWPEVCDRFGWNEHRCWLLAGMLRMATNLRDAGCILFLLDGSFISSKDHPEDYDACCDYTGMDPLRIDARLLMGRTAMKAEFRGEVHPERPLDGDPAPFRDFYQTDRDDVAKGVVILDLGTLP